MAKHPTAKLYRCAGCSHVFSVLDAPSVHYDHSYYDHEHKRWFEHPNHRIFTAIEHALRADARSLLDVGCGRGDFLRFLSEKRPGLKLTGIDLSEQASSAQYEFVRCDVAEFKTEKHFDAIVSLAVVEHVDAPKVFVRRLVELLDPGGQFFLLTLNEDSILYDLAKFLHSVGISIAFNRLYSAHHVNHFTRESLRTLVAQSGLVIDKTVMHNSPLRAVDIPAQSRILDTVLRAGVAVIHVAGTLSGRTYLQTVIAHRAD